MVHDALRRRHLLLFPFLYLSVVTLLLYMLCSAPLREDDALQPRIDRSLDQVLRPLSRHLRSVVQLEAEIAERNLHLREIIESQFPWMIRNNTLPNGLLHASDMAGGVQTDSEGSPSHLNSPVTNAEDYRRGIRVFVHVPRASGTALIQCMYAVSANASLVPGPTATGEFRTVWDTDIFTVSYKQRFDFHHGREAFGLCETVQNRACSYYMVMRDPWQRALSSYQYCKEARGDPRCQIENANEVSLRDWILSQGSTIFQQLIFSSHICGMNLTSEDVRDDATYNATEATSTLEVDEDEDDSRNVTRDPYDISVEVIDEDGTQPDEHVYRQMFHHRLHKTRPKDPPCWYKHKLWVDSLTDNDRSNILEFVLQNLERWFAVLGTTQDLEGFLRALHDVYKLPFNQCAKIKLVEDLPRKRKQKAWKETLISNSAHGQVDPVSDDSVEELQFDDAVLNALDADIQIYNKVRDLVRLQDQIVFNRVR